MSREQLSRPLAMISLPPMAGCTGIRASSKIWTCHNMTRSGTNHRSGIDLRNIIVISFALGENAGDLHPFFKTPFLM